MLARDKFKTRLYKYIYVVYLHNFYQNSVKKIYDTLEEEEQFDPSKSYNDPINQTVSSFLTEQLSSEYSQKYSGNQINRCVYRYYESRRRAFLDCQPERGDKKKENDRKTKLSQRQRTLYRRRQKALKGEREITFWKEINHSYMSFESSDEDEDGKAIYKVHTPAWRSRALAGLVSKLDERIQKDKDGCTGRSGYVRFRREMSSFHLGHPPLNAPSWTVNSNYQDNIPSSANADRLEMSESDETRCNDFIPNDAYDDNHEELTDNNEMDDTFSILDTGASNMHVPVLPEANSLAVISGQNPVTQRDPISDSNLSDQTPVRSSTQADTISNSPNSNPFRSSTQRDTISNSPSQHPVRSSTQSDLLN
jgi:hypothetical protein